MIKVTAGLVVILILAIFLADRFWLSAPKYDGPDSDHFNGSRFFNRIPVEKSFADFMKWMLSRQPGEWSGNHKPSHFPPPPQHVHDGIRITFINHATLLIQVNGVNILTDPIWSERCSPVSFIGPKRVRPPGIPFETLPPIDAVLISHNHYDHLDLPTLKRLAKTNHLRIFAGLGNSALFENEKIAHTRDMDWWDSETLANDVKVIAVPAQHFSGRGLADRNSTLWMGFVIVVGTRKIYFAGDTGLGPHFAEIRQRFGPMDVSLLPIGAFLPRWFMGHVHLAPDEAVEAAQILQSKHSVGIHFGTFGLADDGEHDPPIELRRALKQLKQPVDFHLLDFGEGRSY